VSRLVSGSDASLGKHPASWVWRLAASQAFRPVRRSLVHKSVHEAVVGMPGRGGAVRSVGSMLARLPLPIAAATGAMLLLTRWLTVR
jgi:hypothetical protein